MKKICFYVDSVFNLGGIQRVVCNLTNFLIDDYDITILCSRHIEKTKQVDYCLNSKIKIEYLPEASIYSKVLNFVFKPFRLISNKILKISKKSNLFGIINYQTRYNVLDSLKKFFKENKFDYILCEGLKYCILFSLIKDKLKLNSITIGCWHSSYDNYSNNYPTKLIIKSLNILDKTVVLSNIDKEQIKKNYKIDVDYIYNPVNRLKNIDEIEIKKSKKFISIGRYSDEKGFDNLIKSFKIFHQYNQEWMLEIVGEGEERTHLQNLIDCYNLGEYIKLVGTTNHIENYYLSSSVFLISSKYEGLPMVVLEAMQYKLPIIAYDIPIFHEILPKSVPLVEQENYDLFAKKMNDVVCNRNNINKMVNDYDQYLNNFLSDSVIKKWKQILK